MPIEIWYESDRLRKEFENPDKLRKKYGALRAKLIIQRLSEFRAANRLSDLQNLPGPRLHQHTRKQGQAKAIFSVDLDHPYRLLVEAADEPEPTLPTGGVDLSRITRLLIKGVFDPHG